MCFDNRFFVYSGLPAVGKTELVKRELLQSSKRELSDKRIVFFGFSENQLSKEYLANFNDFLVITEFSQLISYLQSLINDKSGSFINEFIVIDESRFIFCDIDRLNQFSPLFFDLFKKFRVSFLFITVNTSIFPVEFKMYRWYLLSRFLSFRFFNYYFRGFLFKTHCVYLNGF